MSTHVTLAEAATFLGVSKATLRNWDKSGKLKAVRHPVNDYRVYNINELKALRDQMPLFENEPLRSQVRAADRELTPREVRALVGRLHNIMRDADGDSSLIARFDELTKLLFLAMHAAKFKRVRNSLHATERQEKDYAAGLRADYKAFCSELPFEVPKKFIEISCSDKAIHACGKALSLVELDQASIDVKGLAYEEMIKKTFDKTDNQQFFTPSQIVKFIVDVFDNSLGGKICDPASGTGGFLVEVAKRKNAEIQLTGFEVDERLAWVTGINAYIHGAETLQSIQLKGGGTLGAAAKEYYKTFDFIITNPPFGSDYSDEDELQSFCLGKGRSSRRRGILFIERCYHLLNAAGRMAMIIDEGVLNLPHAQDVRQFIIDSFDIEAIVSLPESAFMPYASVNASILFLRKKSATRRVQKTFFARAEKVGRKANGDDDIIYNVDGSSDLSSDLPKILQGWKAGEDGSIDPHLFFWSDTSQFAKEENGYRLDFRFHHPSRWQSRQRLDDAYFPLRTISEICSERNETVIPSKELADTVIPYTGLAHIESHTGVVVQEPTPTNSLKSSVKRYMPGDVLFARMRPNLRKVAVMDFPDSGYTSPECVVMVPKNDQAGVPIINALVLSVVLRSDLVQGQIAHLTAGIGRPRLNTTDLRNVLIPVPPKEIQDDIAKSYLSELESAKRLRAEANRLLEDAQTVENKAVDKLGSNMSGLV